MSVDIHELAAELLDDYLAFFDNDAFADFPWWSAHNDTGPLEMYRKVGFALHHQLELFAVARKAL